MRKDIKTLSLAFFLLFFWKLFLLATLTEDTFFLFPQIDGKWYQKWALDIAQGNWFSEHPFYQAPFYPYLLGISYLCFGTEMWITAFWQILLSCFTALFLFRFTEHLFDRRAAWSAFVLYALFGMLYFYEIQPIKTTTALFFTSLVLWSCLKSGITADFRTGLAMGVLTLLRENTLLWIPFLLFWKGRTRKRALLPLGIGLLLPFCLTLYHNYSVCGEWILITYQGGTNFYIGNNPKANGTYMPLRMGRQTPQYEGKDARELACGLAQKKLSYQEVSRFWLKKGLQYLWEHPGDGALLWGKKFLFFFSPQEFPDGLSYRFFRDHHFPYPLLFVGYGTLWLLALATIPRLSFRHKEHQLLISFLVINLLSVVPFYLFCRYRLPVVLGLLPLAGYACRYRYWLVCGIVLGIFLEYRPATDYQNSYYLTGNLSRKLWEEKGNDSDWEEAREAYQKAIRGGPFPEAWEALGTLYLKKGDWNEAERYYRKALSEKEDFPVLLYQLGALLISKARQQHSLVEKKRLLKEAEGLLQKGLLVDPEEYKLLANLGMVYWNYWKIAPQEEVYRQKAHTLFQEALKRAPEDSQLRKMLGELD